MVSTSPIKDCKIEIKNSSLNNSFVNRKESTSPMRKKWFDNTSFA
jgi:hypothetical protein